MKVRLSSAAVLRGIIASTAIALAPPVMAQDSNAAPAVAGVDAGLEVMGRITAAQTAGRADDEVLDGSAATLRITPSLALDTGPVLLTFSNGLSWVEYFADERSDRWQNVARLTAEFGAGSPTSFQLNAERSDNIITAEAPLVDEWEAGARVSHALDDANRLSVGVRWRERSYDGAVRASGNGPRIDAEFRHRFGANHFVYLRGRHDAIGSADARRDLNRWTAIAIYQRPLATDLLLRPGVSVARVKFPGRALAAGGFRRDTLISPEVELAYSPGAWRFAASAGYVARLSTDPAFDRSGYRFALEISRDF